MSKLVLGNDWLDEECGNMAREGLRTLVIARKKLSNETLSLFEREYSTAKLKIHDRNIALQNVISKHLERDLELLGLSGVEDKLQDDVKPTLELLRNAGLKIWMLTGDKIETATCIAISSRLVSRNQIIHVISKILDPDEASVELEFVKQKRDACLVIDGESLATCLESLEDFFMEVAVSLPIVVCCRCSPTQKAQITSLIKKYTGKKTCAIGDGGNDVIG